QTHPQTRKPRRFFNCFGSIAAKWEKERNQPEIICIESDECQHWTSIQNSPKHQPCRDHIRDFSLAIVAQGIGNESKGKEQSHQLRVVTSPEQIEHPE